MAYGKYTGIFSDQFFHWVEKSDDSDQSGLAADRFDVRRMPLGHAGKLEYVFYFRELAEMRFHPDNPFLFFQTARAKGLLASNGAELVVVMSDIGLMEDAVRQKP